MKQLRIILATIIPILLVAGIIYAANTFPTTLNSWSEGDVITHTWGNALESEIGVNSSDVSGSLNYIVGSNEQPLGQIGAVATTTGSILYTEAGIWKGTTTLPTNWSTAYAWVNSTSSSIEADYASTTYYQSAYFEVNASSSAWDAASAHRITIDAVSGLVKCDGSGGYSAVTDSSSNWDSAYTEVNASSSAWDSAAAFEAAGAGVGDSAPDARWVLSGTDMYSTTSVLTVTLSNYGGAAILTLGAGGTISTTTDGSTNWDSAYTVVNASSTKWDSASAATPSATTTAWNQAYGWGDHSTQSYLTSPINTGERWVRTGSDLYASSTSAKVFIATTTGGKSLDVYGEIRGSSTTTMKGLELSDGTHGMRCWVDGATTTCEHF